MAPALRGEMARLARKPTGGALIDMMRMQLSLSKIRGASHPAEHHSRFGV